MRTQAPADTAARPPWRSIAAGAVLVVVVVGLFLLLRGGGDSGGAAGLASTGASGTTAAPVPRAVTPAQLAAVAGQRGLAVYWAGAQPGRTYELTTTDTGQVYVRYLPAGVKPGDPRPDFLTVGSYTENDPVTSVKQASVRKGAQSEKLPGGGLAVANAARPNSWYFASPDEQELVEVFSPTPGRARELVRSGRVAAVEG
jgi:hypothetical protein